MITELIVTDITNMHADRICIAAINRQGQSIRPLYKNRSIYRNWCSHSGHTIQQFSKIKLDLLYNRPMPPHTEDWIIDDNYKEVIGVIAETNRKSILEKILDPHVQSIFGAVINQDGQGRYIFTGQGNRSLGTVRVNALEDYHFGNYDGRNDYRLLFTDVAGNQYRIKVVDDRFQSFSDQLFKLNKNIDKTRSEILQRLQSKEIFLRVGLARGWASYPTRCYLQITGVYTFPDYQ